MTSDELPGINKANVTLWLKERSQVDGEVSFAVDTHGRSNLTYKLGDEAG